MNLTLIEKSKGQQRVSRIEEWKNICLVLIDAFCTHRHQIRSREELDPLPSFQHILVVMQNESPSTKYITDEKVQKCSVQENKERKLLSPSPAISRNFRYKHPLLPCISLEKVCRQCEILAQFNPHVSDEPYL